MLESLDPEDFDDGWVPESDSWVFWLDLFVGRDEDDRVDEPGADVFSLRVGSPAWLAEKVGRAGGIHDGRHILLVEPYDWPRIRAHIDRHLAGCAGATWDEVGEQVGRLGHWEFEDATLWENPAPVHGGGPLRAALRWLHSLDVDDPGQWVPESDAWSMRVEFGAGPDGGPGDESFRLTLCSPAWLAAEVRREGLHDCRHHLVVEPYDWPRILSHIEERVRDCEGATGDEVTEKVGRLGHLVPPYRYRPPSHSPKEPHDE